MYEQEHKSKENKSRAVANSVGQKKSNKEQCSTFVDHRSPKFNALISKINNQEGGKQGNDETIQMSKKYDALSKKANKPATVTNDEIIEATKELISELFATGAYKDAEENDVQVPQNVILGEDYGAALGMLLLPSKENVCSDISNGVFNLAIGHEMGHYVRTIDNKNESGSFPTVEEVINEIDWNALAAKYPSPKYNMNSWKEEIRADLKGIKLHFNKNGKVPGESKIQKFGQALGDVVDNMHPPAKLRTNAIRSYVREIKPTCCCYITNACVESKGLSDDCEELTILRYFRDNYLAKMKNGKELIKIYYKNSPDIVEAINMSDDSNEIYNELYEVIKLCIEAIKDGNNQYAYDVYCNMVIDLKQSFLPNKELLDEDDTIIDKTIEQIMNS